MSAKSCYFLKNQRQQQQQQQIRRRQRRVKFVPHAAGKNASSSTNKNEKGEDLSGPEISEEEVKSKNQLFGQEVLNVDELDEEVKSLAVSSEETQVLNREHHIEGFVAISDS